MKKPKLPVSKISLGSAQTAFGWVGFAVSPKGLSESRFVFETEEKALFAVSSLFDPEKVCFDPVVSKYWSAVFKEFFEGKLKSFENIPLDCEKWTEFQKKVYMSVQSIPYGKTASYSAVASFLGNDKASRAVGNALRKNPVPPIVPCHRVIASDKNLCGFSATGGIELKLKMLKLEKDNI